MWHIQKNQFAIRFCFVPSWHPFIILYLLGLQPHIRSSHQNHVVPCPLLVCLYFISWLKRTDQRWPNVANTHGSMVTQRCRWPSTLQSRLYRGCCMSRDVGSNPVTVTVPATREHKHREVDASDHGFLSFYGWFVGEPCVNLPGCKFVTFF